MTIQMVLPEAGTVVAFLHRVIPVAVPQAHWVVQAVVDPIYGLVEPHFPTALLLPVVVVVVETQLHSERVQAVVLQAVSPMVWIVDMVARRLPVAPREPIVIVHALLMVVLVRVATVTPMMAVAAAVVGTVAAVAEIMPVAAAVQDI